MQRALCTLKRAIFMSLSRAGLFSSDWMKRARYLLKEHYIYSNEPYIYERRKRARGEGV